MTYIYFDPEAPAGQEFTEAALADHPFRSKKHLEGYTRNGKYIHVTHISVPDEETP